MTDTRTARERIDTTENPFDERLRWARENPAKALAELARLMPASGHRRVLIALAEEVRLLKAALAEEPEKEARSVLARAAKAAEERATRRAVNADLGAGEWDACLLDDADWFRDAQRVLASPERERVPAAETRGVVEEPAEGRTPPPSPATDAEPEIDGYVVEACGKHDDGWRRVTYPLPLERAQAVARAYRATAVRIVPLLRGTPVEIEGGSDG